MKTQKAKLERGKHTNPRNDNTNRGNKAREWIPIAS